MPRAMLLFRFGTISWIVLPMLIGHLLAKQLWGAGDPKPATILTEKLNLRAGPGRHNPPIATLPKGAKVLVLSYEGEWVRILFEDLTGFILNRESYLRIHEPGEAGREDSRPPTSTTRRSGNLDRELKITKEKVAAISEEETNVINALEETQQALDSARKNVKRLQDELATVELRIEGLQEQYQEIQRRADANEPYVAGRLTAFYKLSRLGQFHVLASADSMFDFFTGKRALQQILAQDDAIMAQLSRDKLAMQTLLAKMETQKTEKATTAASLNQRIEAMKIEQDRRAMLLETIRNEKSLQLAAMDALMASARALDQTVNAFTAKTPAQTSLPEVMEKPFAELKGLLMMPVKGKVITFFGQYRDSQYNVVHFQSGIRIKADRGEPVRAVYSGRTLFSSWFKGFGNMIIIDHGDHYYSVYAQLEDQFKSKGDWVEAGEVIATVGDMGALTGAGLHFELRHHGKPMNPLGWIKKG